MDVTICDARSAHLPQLEALECACFSAPWTRAQLASQLPDDRHVFLIAAAGETVLISNLGQSRLEPETRTFELQLLPNGAQGGGTDHARPGLSACNTLRAGQESGRAAAKFPTKPTAEGALGG